MVPQQDAQPPELQDEESLVAQMKLSDEEARSAFEKIYRAYGADLFRFAYGYLRDRAAAEDLVADVCLTIWKRRAVWTPRYGVRAYLFTATQRGALNLRRGEKRAARWHSAAYDEMEESEAYGDGFTHDENLDESVIGLKSRVQEAVAALPEDARRIAELRWRDGFSPVEIAAILGINRAAVDNRISRLLKRLRAQFGDPR